MSTRKYLCGNEKRKLRKEKEEFVKKLPSVAQYFAKPSIEQCQSVTPSTTVSASTSLLSTTNDNIISNDQLNDHNVPVLDKNEPINSTLSENTVEEVVKIDPALWPLRLYENSLERNKYLQKDFSYFQNKNSTFQTSKRHYNKQNRYFSPHLFNKKLQNGERCERKWLMFSEVNGSVFCYVCKLFSEDCDNSFVKNGFSNWKNADEVICSHENGKEHNKCMMEYIVYSSKNLRIDKNMVEALENEAHNWFKVLKRVVAIVRFLAERGLPFRGTNEVIGSPNNGNFLGLVELLAEFDPFLEEHIKLHANKGRGHVSYLSKTIYEEFIEEMAKKVIKHIINEVKSAKYWGLVLDSTPDISHVDQLSVVFRYFINNHVYERFFCFLPIKNHKGRSMADNVLNLLNEHGIEIEDCRAQTYDNASNMSGKYNGLQACIREKNSLAFYVPCIGHSLNLVGDCSVEECIIATNFFGILQQLFVFFSASTHRWEILRKQNSNLKNLSKTRWSRRSDASRALKKNFVGIYKALKEITNDVDQKKEVRNEASILINHIIKLENAFMTVLWDCVLSRFEDTSQYLQKVDVDLISASAMFSSLIHFIKDLRNKFSDFEDEAKKLSDIIKQEYSDSTRRKIVKRLADGEVQASTLSAPDKFRIETFYVIIDKLVAELEERSRAYDHITELFGFLQHLMFIDENDLNKRVANLVQVYADDLNDCLLAELKQFIKLLKLQVKGFFSNRSNQNDRENDKILSSLKVLNWMVDLDMIHVFPNTYIAYRLLVTVPIANCETERSFSVLKRIKNMFRATMIDERLSALSRLSIEKDLLRSLDFDDIITEFAGAKARKKYI